MASRGVDQDHVHSLERPQSRLRDLHRVLRFRVAVERRVRLLGELLELVVGRGPMDVRRDEPDGQPFLLEVLPQLPRGRRLALAVQTDEEDPLFLDRDFPRGPEDLHELFVDDPDDVLPRAHPRGRLLLEGAPLELPRDCQGELDVHIGLEEGALDVPHDLLDERLVDVARARDLTQGRTEGVAELLEDHSSPRRVAWSLRLTSGTGSWAPSIRAVARAGRRS